MTGVAMVSVLVIWVVACVVCWLKGRSSWAVLLGPFAPLWMLLAAVVAGVIGMLGWPAQHPQDALAELEPAVVGGLFGGLAVGVVLVVAASVGALRPAAPASWWAARRGESRQLQRQS